MNGLPSSQGGGKFSRGLDAPQLCCGVLHYAQTVGIPTGVLTHTGVQWTQLDASGGPNTGNVVDGGRVEDPTATSTNGGKWYAYPHIAVNRFGDIILGFTQFASSQYPSAGYTFHARTDGAGVMKVLVIYKPGEDYYHKDFGSGRNRWGDFSKAQVDPSNDTDLWVLQEYAKARVGTDDGTTGSNSSRWGTWWGKVSPPAWVFISGNTDSAPALAWNPIAGTIQMLVKAADDSIWKATFSGNGTFSNDWQKISGKTASSPVIAWDPTAQKMLVVVRAEDDSIWKATINSDGTFNDDWQNIPGMTASPPAIVWNPVASDMQMVVRASDNSIWKSTFSSNGAFNNDWASISGQTVESPALAWDELADSFGILVRAGDSSIWFASLRSDGVFRDDWAVTPGRTASAPAMAWNGGINVIQIVVRASDGSIWVMEY